jgi:hypothetical protein
VRVLLVNPPLADPAGPYPAICYLAGYLDTVGYRAELADASLALLLRVFSREGVREIERDIRRRCEAGSLSPDAEVARFLKYADAYSSTVETAIACLQGKDQGALARAARPGYFPPPLDPGASWAHATYFNVQSAGAALGGLTAEQTTRLTGSRRPLGFAFGARGQSDEACFLASVLLADIARVIRLTMDDEFELNAYADRVTDDLPMFAPLAERLRHTSSGQFGHATLIDRAIDEIAEILWREHTPDVLGMSVPFGGSLYGALRIAAHFKSQHPAVRIVLGGGWINTQLRDLSDPGIFDVVDFITLDDGERPLQCVLEHVAGTRPADRLMRTFRRVGGRVVFENGAAELDVPFGEAGTPTYRGLPLDRYLRLRSSVQSFKPIAGRRWNKLTLAHGCYWKKCAFCDTSLDYIGRYDPASVDVLMDRIARLQDETGESGFHFVDEAMPPSLLRQLAERLVKDGRTIAWWGNVRFDRALIPMAPLLAESGCIGMTGGLEVATDRLLALMEKGVSLEQAAQVCDALSSAGIFTHAYLIYGFPTETAADTVDALEFVRQMFDAGCLHSAFWHRFELTAFSPIARDPARYGITIPPQPKHPFSNYLLKYCEPGAPDHDQFSDGLRRAVEHYMLGIGLERPVTSWFDAATPPPTIAPGLVRSLLSPS